MRAVVLLTALVTLGCAFAVHVVWWRTSRPKADLPAMLGLFLIAPGILYLVVAMTGALGVLSPVECAAAFVLHAALASAYVQTYPAAQAQSPTLVILLAIGAAPAGLDRSALVARLDASGLVRARVEDLERNALLRRDGDRIVLTLPGLVLARAFVVYRSFVGLRPGGGG